MLEKQVINHRQMAWIVGTLLTGGGFLSTQNELIRIARMDAWLSYIVPVFYAFGICFAIAYLARKFPGKHLFEISFLAAGKWLGGLINLLMLFHIWLILLRNISGFTGFAKIILLPRTPEAVLIFMFLLLAMYFGRTGIETLVRTNDIFFPVFVTAALILPFTLINEMHIRFLEPPLISSFARLLGANTLMTGFYGDVFVAGVFMHTLASSRELKASMRHGVVSGTFILTIFVGMELLVFGSRIPANLLYPNYNLVQQIHLTDFLDRVDLIMLSIWFFIVSTKVLIIYQAFLVGLASLFGQRDYRIFNKPAVLLLSITTLTAFKNQTQAFVFDNYGSLMIVLLYQPLMFILLPVLAALRKPSRKTGAAGEDGGGTPAPSGPAEDPSGSGRTACQASVAGTEAAGEQTGRGAGTSRPDAGESIARNAGAGRADSGGSAGRGAGAADGADGRKRAEGGGSGSPSPGRGDIRGSGSFLQQLAYRKDPRSWNRRTNLLLCAGLAAVALGIWLTRGHAAAGVIMCAAYALCLLLALLTSYMEIVTSTLKQK